MSLTAIEKITRKASRIKNGNDKIQPGQPVRISDAATVNDAIRQGDLYLIVIAEESVPDNYEALLDPAEKDKQLVPGNTQGAKHYLDSLDGVSIYRPQGWGDDWDQQEGPCLVLVKERTVLHPTHGSVTIPAGFTVQCVYQREWDAELRRERRNAD